MLYRSAQEPPLRSSDRVHLITLCMGPADAKPWQLSTQALRFTMQPGTLDFALLYVQSPVSQQHMLVCGQQDLHVPAWPAAATACCNALHTAVVPTTTRNQTVSPTGAMRARASTLRAERSPPTAMPAPAATTDADSSGDDTDLEYWDYHRLSRQVRAASRA